MVTIAVIILVLTACALACAVIAARKKPCAVSRAAVVVTSVLLILLGVYFAANYIYNYSDDGKPDPIAAVTDTNSPDTYPESAESETGAEQDTETEPFESESAESESEITSESEESLVPETEYRVKSETEPVFETEYSAESETEAVVESETVPITQKTTEPVTVPETIPETEPETETIPETTPETEVETESEVETEPVVDYTSVAKKFVGDTVDRSIELVTAARIEGSFETYPFEKKSSRDTLTEKQKLYYDAILDAAHLLEELTFFESELSAEEIEDVRTANEAFRADHPKYTYYTRLDENVTDSGTVLKFHYFLPSDNSVTVTDDKDALMYDIAVFEAVCDYIVDSMPEDFCTYDKYRYLASVVSLSTVYDHNGEGGYVADTPYGPLMDGVAICIGYTVAFEYLCESADLYCTRVWGTTYNNLIHMWNVVKLDSGTYHVDVTWSDSDKNTPCQKNWQKYYMLTQAKVLTNHIISDGTVATGTVESFK